MTKRRPLKTSAVAMVLSCLLVAQVFLSCGIGVPVPVHADTLPDVYVGIDLAYGLPWVGGRDPIFPARVADAKALIDKVSPYTNFFVLGASGIADYADIANETLQYAYEKGLYFVTLYPSVWEGNSGEWDEYANDTWGNHLLGYYTKGAFGDEPGGRQLDNKAVFNSANSNADAASKFVTGLEHMMRKNPFTSDYCFYWFDYKAGYDTLFAEFIQGCNNQLAVALCRGAATALNKDWGVIITYGASFVETGSELYNDMILAYDNGAKYIVVFDSNYNHNAGSLGPEHFQAIQQFWQYTQQNPRNSIPTDQRVAYVLPKDYGVGLRWRDEKIWGLFDADNVSVKLYDDANSLLAQYGRKLDIVYDDGLQFFNVGGYSQYIYWNDYYPPPSPTPTPSLSPSPSPTQTPNPPASPSPTIEPTPTTEPTQTVEPTASQSLPPSQEPTTPPNQNQPLTQETYYVIAFASAILIIVAVGILLKKRVTKRMV